MRTGSYSQLIVVLLCALLSFSVDARKKDYNSPHHHQGILPPYEAGPFTSVKLNNKDEKSLESGKSVMKQSMPKEGEVAGGAVCVQDVMAPKEAVWHQILDLDNYTKKVNKLSFCKNYFVNKNNDGTHTIKTRMIMNVMPGYKFESYYDHTVNINKGSLVWKLDYDKTSDFDDVSGHWHVEDHPTKEGCTRVFYACDIKLKAAVPKPVLNFIGKAALKQATGWVKRESESSPELVIQSQYSQPVGMFAKK